jgi:hypothetical protein
VISSTDDDYDDVGGDDDDDDDDSLFQMPVSATLKKTPFSCTCVRELWLMLQLYLDRIHVAEHGKVSN